MKGSCAMPAVETGEGKARPKGDMFSLRSRHQLQRLPLRGHRHRVEELDHAVGDQHGRRFPARLVPAVQEIFAYLRLRDFIRGLRPEV